MKNKIERVSSLASVTQSFKPNSSPPILLKWAGGKSSLASVLLGMVEGRNPERLIEPFAGGAALFFHAKRSAILADANVSLIAFYEAIKCNASEVGEHLDRIREAAASLSGQEFSDYYYAMRDKFPAEERSESAALLLFLNRHCWNGLYRENRQGRFNTPIGSASSLQPMPSLDQLSVAARALKRAKLLVGDFAETLRHARKGDLVYLDPPYLPVSATARFANYSGGSFGWRDHVRLKRSLYELDKRGIDFILSNSCQELTESFYSDFHQQVVSVTAPINSQGSRRQPRKELLVTNFKPKNPVRVAS